MPSPTRYGDLGSAIGELVHDLTDGRISHSTRCHLDPDLDPAHLPRLEGWRGSLGQVATAEGHLRRQGVQRGDLFLFFGLFRQVERSDRWRFIGPREHRIFGWLQVDCILDLGPDGSHALRDRPWLRDHPHARAGWGVVNRLYVATERLRLPGLRMQQRGWGLFRDGKRLTASDRTPSIWLVPDWLNPSRGGTGMTYHPLARWGTDGTVRIVGRGQEFVADIGNRDDAAAWLAALFGDASV